ncbi:MAG TPA: GspE/PulE family protein [Holophaga sp.]|nr:GspE/PulE family protein [Holophaga sp.]
MSPAQAAGELSKTDPRATPLYPTLDLTREVVDFALFQAIPLDLMLKHRFVPVHERDGHLWLAMADPLDVVAQDALRMHLKRPLRFAAAPYAQIQVVLKKSESGQKVLEEAGEALRVQVLREEDIDEDVLDLENLTDKDEAPIIRLVDTTIFNALQRRASDIHLETTSSGFQIKYRIDGSLYAAAEPIDRRFASPIISRIKVMSELDIAEKRKPQDGRFKLKVRGRAIDFRVSIMPTIHGEDSVIRILDKENLSEEFKSLSLDILGFSQRELLRLRRFAREPYGMFLVTGPTGSGKTTTLYAVLSEIKSPEDKLITIEDPVEYQLEGVTQIPVNEKKGLTFAVGLRSILRHDPDKILVGEIRDSETAQIAIQSALTGHLVFTTVHANHTLDVLSRFQHMGVEVYNFVSALNCILAQRLVRTLCPKCKRAIPAPGAEELKENGLTAEWAKDATFYEKVGCVDCNGTGFRGRQAIIEFMGLNDDLRELITRRASVREIKEAARSFGMQSLRESAVEKVRLGLTTLAEINKVTFRESE